MKTEPKTELVTLIKQLVGDRSIRKTGQDSGVTASYITGILKQKYMPSAEILRKLTDPKAKPQNGITLRKLMVAAGYQLECDTSTFDQLMQMIKERDMIIETQRKQLDEIRRVICI